MKHIAPWLLALFFLFLFIGKTLECMSLNDTLRQFSDANDRLMAADQKLREATENLMSACGNK